jgi:hypothetical protein|tara:strand:+ start:4822 stop:5457 length:636 start_codon:yes stop_codon:yes gene_type:complete
MPRHKAAVHTSDVAFSPTVKAIQSRKGSRAAYAKMEARGSWPSTITDDLAAFIKAQTSVYLATVNATGQPYIQHRGGPPGFLRVIDDKTIGFADFVGNRQYITSGNLSDNAKAHLFLMDYTNLRRVKIWGTACVVEDDVDLIDTLIPKDYEARPEQALLFTVVAWDTNCPQHIPRRFDAADFAMVVASRDERIAELESEIRQLKNEDASDI